MSITDRIDKITELNSSSLLIPTPAPNSVKIELTSSCNLNCFYCSSSRREQSQNIDFSFFKKIVADIKECKIEEIGLFYLGESTLYPHLCDAVKYVKDSGFKHVFLTTNGIKLDDHLLNDLFSAGLDSLKFSLNYHSAAHFELVTKKDKNLYFNIIKNIKRSKEIRDQVNSECEISCSSILYSNNFKQTMQSTIEEVRQYVDEHYWLPLYSQVDTCDTSIKGNPGRFDNMKPSVPCWALFKEGHVTVDGNVSACCYSKAEEFIMGNLHTDTFSNIWNSKKFQELRQQHIHNQVNESICHKCING